MQDNPGQLPALRDYQAKVLRALLAATERQRAVTLTVMFPRQAGKNEVSAALVAATLLGNARRGGSIVVCAPTAEPQAAISLERTARALRAIARLLPGGVQPRISGTSLSVGRASAVFLSGSPAANVAGHTASLLLIGDEAQDLDAEWFNRQFRPMAASTGACTVLFGTAWDGETLLERQVAHNRNLDALRHGEPYEGYLPFHHEVGWRDVAAAIPAYGDYVRAERARLGANHPLFLTQYELVPADGAGRMFTSEQLRAVQGSHPRLAAPVPGERYAAGLDLAGQGADATVLTIARIADGRCEVVAHQAWHALPFGQLLREAEAALRHWRPAHVCADATGLGGPLVAQLQQALGSQVEGVTFTASEKSALGYELLAAANTGRLALYADSASPALAACLRELRECRSTLREGGGMSWAAPPGRHDDYVVSLALCLRASNSVRPPRIAIGRPRA